MGRKQRLLTHTLIRSEHQAVGTSSPPLYVWGGGLLLCANLSLIKYLIRIIHLFLLMISKLNTRAQ